MDEQDLERYPKHKAYYNLRGDQEGGGGKYEAYIREDVS